MTGSYPTVGIAGRYTQDEGNSPLHSAFGSGADYTLEFEVITAQGELVTAWRTENEELSWTFRSAPTWFAYAPQGPRSLTDSLLVVMAALATMVSLYLSLSTHPDAVVCVFALLDTAAINGSS